jgi:glutaconate CoA-transferase subunit A
MAKWTTLSEAVKELIHDGDTVALEGFTHLIPFAAGHEIIRQGLRELSLVRMTPDVIYDQLIGAGCARKLTFSWGGNPGVGSLHRLRDAVEQEWPRPLELEERSHADLANAYVAGAANLPFAVMRGYSGSDLPKFNPQIRNITCPFTGEQLAATPAVRPDVMPKATFFYGESLAYRRKPSSPPSARSSPWKSASNLWTLRRTHAFCPPG